MEVFGVVAMLIVRSIIIVSMGWGGTADRSKLK
jgi:hypothetical protein